jgi:hypothetical protein
MEAAPGVKPGIKVLHAFALSLGHAAQKNVIENISHNNNTKSIFRLKAFFKDRDTRK